MARGNRVPSEIFSVFVTCQRLVICELAKLFERGKRVVEFFFSFTTNAWVELIRQELLKMLIGGSKSID
jgi:hypothetical protein